MLVGLSRVLWIFTPVASSMALLFYTVALCTGHWLHSEEKIKVELNNHTLRALRTISPHLLISPDEKDILLPKLTISGLWTMCYTEPGHIEMHCFSIDYFPDKEYSPDPADSTMAIPYAVTRAAIFYLVSLVLLLFGEITCIFGHCFNCRKIFIFISGCTFITTGLTILAGLVIYISTFKSEVGAKLQEQSTFQPALFTYNYGFSFLLVVACFLATELSGTSAIFLYIRLSKKNWSVDILKQSSSNAHPLSNAYSSRGPPLLHGLRLNLGKDEEFPPPPPPPCRRHTNHHRRRSSGSGSRFYDYYLSRENSPRPSLVRSLVAFHTLPSHSGSYRGGGSLWATGIEAGPAAGLGLVHGYGCPAYRSESMRELSYYSLPLTSRDLTCNTMSTTADVNRQDYGGSRGDFTYDALRRTTPV